MKKVSALHFARYWLLFLLLMGLFAPILSNRLPLAVKIKDFGWVFPAFNSGKVLSLPDAAPQVIRTIRWEAVDVEFRINPLLPFSPDKRGKYRLAPPGYGDPYHIWGADAKGKDVFASCIYGIRTAAWFSIPALIVMVTLGFILGLGGGLGRKAEFTVSLWALSFFLLGMFFWCSAHSWIRYSSSFLSVLLFSCIAFGALLINKLSKIKHIRINLDFWFMRLSEWLGALPRLLIILVFSGLSLATDYRYLALIIGLSSWPYFYRIIRVAVKEWSESEAYWACKNAGLPFRILLIRHIIPLCWPLIVPGLCTALIGLLTLEASLSFLNVGLPAGHQGWGTLIQQGKQYSDAWWLIAFPGSMLLLTILAFFRLAKTKKVIDT
jgi:peptide/nickel transport system permease protein